MMLNGNLQKQGKELFCLLGENGYVSIPGEDDLPDEVVKHIKSSFGLTVENWSCGWDVLKNRNDWHCCVAWEVRDNCRLFVYIMIRGKWIGGLIDEHVPVSTALQWFNDNVRKLK